MKTRKIIFLVLVVFFILFIFATVNERDRNGAGPIREWVRDRIVANAPATPIAHEGIQDDNTVEKKEFAANAVRVGDSNTSYANIEFTSDGKYMVWFEQALDGSLNGTVWHCSIDPATGIFIPPDCKGFRAFESTAYGRANPGMDKNGAYYVGADRSGKIVFVRPSGPTSGDTTILATHPDPARRSVYPSDLASENKRYVFWIKNERVPGSGLDRRNDWFELQMIDADDPMRVEIIERQDKPLIGFAPMDVGFARWFRGKSLVSYGSKDTNGYVQVKIFDAASRANLSFVTNDQHHHVDPYSWNFGGFDYLAAGIDGTNVSILYKRNGEVGTFFPAETIIPPSQLENPALAQSHERIVWNGKQYSAYQVNDKKRGFFQTAFSSTGEIWFTTLEQMPRLQWLLTPEGSDMAYAEPEPYVGINNVWIFYNALPKGGDITKNIWSLYRTETPLAR